VIEAANPDSRPTHPIAVCTWCFGDAPLADTLDRIVRVGADGVELAVDPYDVDPATVRRFLAERGLQLVSLTPPNVDIAHPDDAVRARAVAVYERLIDVGAQLGRPLVSCHGLVSRVAPLVSLEREREILAGAVRSIAAFARERGLRVVVEVLNRYESHLVNTAREALDLLERVGDDDVFVLLDAYHMHLEERDPAAALRAVGARLGLYHLADSNREGLGRGQVDVPRQLSALGDVGYRGPIVLECTAPGPNPFTAEKGEGFRDVLEAHLRDSVAWLRAR
jgi:D-psicose/D-tagatose/L-ribulose 3-epimerase